MKRFLTSALWTWVIILLALLCLLAGNQQIQTVQDHEARLEQCTSLGKAFNRLEEGLWNLEAAIGVRKKDPSPEVQQRMMQDLIRLKQAVDEAKRLPAMLTETQGSLIRLETVLILLERNLSLETTNLDEADANIRRALQEVRSASSRLWQQYREIAVEITSRWQEVNLLVLASCLLAAFLAFLLRAYHRDLMDRKEAERALRESEDRYRRLVEVSPDAILVHRDGKILFLNTTGAAMLGLESPKPLLGGDLTQLCGDDSDITKWGKGESRPTHHRLRRMDGSCIEVEVVATQFAYQDHPAMQIVIRDITSQKKQTEALHASEIRYRALFENVAEGVYRSSLAGYILEANSALVAMLGYDSIEDLRAAQIERDLFVDPADRMAAMEVLMENGTLNNYEINLRRKDGALISLLENARVVLDKHGAIECLEGTLTDISHMKQAEEALVVARDQALHVSRLKSEFLANVSHEIRTPMNGIIGMTALLADTSLSEEQKEYADAVRRSAHYLMNIINDVLDFSKIEAGRVELENIEFDLRDCVEDVIELLAEQAQEKNLHIAVTFEPRMQTRFIGDPYRVQQVLTNLVGNAIKFTPTGEVLVRVASTELDAGRRQVDLSVLDTGIGIDQSLEQRLFQPFTQGDGSTTRRFGGTGLGLAISRQLIEMMGGKIGGEVRSGGGSRFWFHVPLTVGAPLPRQAAPVGLKKRALVAIPSSEQREGVLEALEIFGLAPPVLASTGQELLLLAEDAQGQGEPFSILLVHDDMPDMNSVSLSGLLRAAGIDPVQILVRFVRVTHRAAAREHDDSFAATLSDPFRQRGVIEVVQRICGEDSPASILELSQHLTELSLTQPLSTSRVLIAEDNAINQRVAIRMLEKLGLHTQIAENGQKAVDAVKVSSFPVIFMDCQMPEMDGFQATSEIRKWEAANRLPRTPIIAMTAHALPGDRERCLDAGMDDYISKPVSMASLQAVVNRWTHAEQRNGAGLRSYSEVASQ